MLGNIYPYHREFNYMNDKKGGFLTWHSFTELKIRDKNNVHINYTDQEMDACSPPLSLYTKVTDLFIIFINRL